MTIVDSWIYKNHAVEIEADIDPEDQSVSYWHTVRTPNGNDVIAHVDTYDTKRETVNLWIELGYPNRRIAPNGVICNWDYHTLRGVYLLRKLSTDAMKDPHVLNSIWNTYSFQEQRTLLALSQ